MAAQRKPSRKKAPQEPQDRPCVLLCIVCDIRGFTDLTSRVHDYVTGRLAPEGLAANLLDAYIRYVRDTQQRAGRILANQLKGCEYAVKATGDGYLFAVRIANYDTNGLRKVRGESNFTEECRNVVVRAARGVCQLVEEAANLRPSGSNKHFGSLTHDFLKQWGHCIGCKLDWVTQKGNPFLRVAAGITMGMGFFRPGEGTKSKGTVSVPYGDALGHAVNLAFRLCNEAGRNESPRILVDRRAAMVLQAHLRGGKVNVSTTSYRLWPYAELLSLKGIEERWCYALVREKRDP